MASSVTNSLKPGDCDPNTEKWDFRTKTCVPKTFQPGENERITPGMRFWEGANTMFSAYRCKPGSYWDPTKQGCVKYPTTGALEPGKDSKFFSECVKSGKSPAECLQLEKDALGKTTTPPADPKKAAYDKCMATYNDDAACRRVSGYTEGDLPTDDPNKKKHTTLQECIAAGLGTQECNRLYGNDPGTYLPPIGDATQTPSPFDNPGYYSWLVSPAGEMSQEELAYWETQQKSIVDVFEQGWGDIEAQISAAGAGYGTESQEIQVIYQEGMVDALNKAYSEIMYTGLQRRLDEKKAAMDFYTNNKSLELSYAIANGQLTVEMLKTYINADVAYAGIEVDMLRAITENAVARATTDVQIETMRQNWLLIAMQLGMNNEEAEDAWGQIFSQFGAGQKSNITM